MDEQVKSSLEMQDLYFSKFTFDFNGDFDDSPCETTITVNHAHKTDDRNQVRIQVDLTLQSEQKNLKLFLRTMGFFKLNRTEGMSDETADAILTKNTVAIMFPFIRSQVSLLTTQPGMSPILLQPIDINAMLKKQDNKNADD